MGRWEPDGRGRLEVAAMELYVERGFDNTTVAEIADRAGLTERTFYRHFADKREVLFAGSELLADLLAERVAAAPAGAAPLDVVTSALEAAGSLIQGRGGWARQRYAVIAANPELKERELIKLASLSSLLAGALRRRGVKDPDAGLTAEVGIAAFKVAFDDWAQRSDTSDLARLIRSSVKRLKVVAATE